MFRVGEIPFLRFYPKHGTTFSQTLTILHQRRLSIYYLIILSDVYKWKSVAKYSSNVSCLAWGEDDTLACVVSRGNGDEYQGGWDGYGRAGGYENTEEPWWDRI